MTGYTVHTGSTEKFSEGWDNIFGGKWSAKSKTTAQRHSKKKAVKRKAIGAKSAKKTARKKKK